MQLLTQNAKMKKSKADGILLYNFGIPAFLSVTGLKTCPNAKACVKGCYARQGTYRFGNVVDAYEERLTATLSEAFVSIMHFAIKLKAKTGKQLVIRIHDSGDFYSQEYLDKWVAVMQLNPSVQFYAYTKMVSLFKSQGDLPPNFRVIFSHGGSEDNLIDLNNDFHAKVFEETIPSDYTDASHDDLVTALGSSKRIGLVYHGSLKYANTTWDKVN